MNVNERSQFLFFLVFSASFKEKNYHGKKDRR